MPRRYLRELYEPFGKHVACHKLNVDDDAADGAVDPFGRLLLEQCELLKERAKFISQIQALPCFDSFMDYNEAPSHVRTATRTMLNAP